MIPAKQTLITSCTAVLLVIATGCASIMNGGGKEVHFRSEPEGATITITDEKGVTIFRGTTPTVVTLKGGKAYFATKRYQVDYSMEGYEPASTELNGRLSGWYAGNLIFGGLLGLLIIDPLTGAMYTLPKEHVVSMIPARTTSAERTTLHVWNYSDVPEELRPELRRLSEID